MPITNCKLLYKNEVLAEKMIDLPMTTHKIKLLLLATLSNEKLDELEADGVDMDELSKTLEVFEVKCE